MSILLGGLKCQFRERQQIGLGDCDASGGNGGDINVKFCQDPDLWLESAISGHSRAIGNSRNALDSIFLHYLYSASCLGRWSNSRDWPLFSFHSEPRDRYHSRTFCRNIEID